MKYYNIKKKNTRRLFKKKRHKNKTIKGGNNLPTNSAETNTTENNVGISTIITDGILNSFGVERINQTPDEKLALYKYEQQGEHAKELIDDLTNNITDNDGNITLKTVAEAVVDKTADPNFKETTLDALDNVEEISEKIAEVTNDVLENPKVQEAANETAKLIGNAAGKGATNFGTSLVGAIPGISIPVGIARAAGEITDTVANVTKITNDSTELVQELLEKESANLLNKAKFDSHNITNRTNTSINQFNNQHNYIKDEITTKNNNNIVNHNIGQHNNVYSILKKQNGGKNTRRLISKKKLHTKRVRFAL